MSPRAFTWRIAPGDWDPDRLRRETSVPVRESDAAVVGDIEPGDRLFVRTASEFVGILEVTAVPALRGGPFAPVSVLELGTVRLLGVPAGEGVRPRGADFEPASGTAPAAPLHDDLAGEAARLLKAAAEKRRKKRSWLPAEPGPAPVGARRPRWLPESLEPMVSQSDLRSYIYVAVDELVEERVGLSVSEWPWVDASGRVRFAAHEEPQLLGLPKDSFLEFVSERRIVRARRRREVTEADIGFRRRPLAIGDVFAVPKRAMPVLEDLEGHANREQAALDAGSSSVYDVSADAREAAKVAFFGAVAEKLGPERAERIIEERPDPDAHPHDAVPPRPPAPSFESDL